MPMMAVHGLLVDRICSWRNSEDAVYAANDPTNHAANHAADRSCRLHAHTSAMDDTVGDTLCLRRKRESQ